MSRNFIGKTYGSVAAVAHKMVKNAPSGLDGKGVADFCGVNYQTLMSELSRQPGHKLGADMLLPLSDACESDAVVDFLARQRGGVFVPLPDMDVPGCKSLVKPLTESIQDFGEWVALIGEHMRDGKLETVERIAFDAKCDELVAQILSFKKAYHHVQEAQNGDGK